MRAALIIIALAACGGGKDEGASASEGTAAKTTDGDKPLSEARTAVVDAWKKAGLTASDLKASTAFGKDCSTGTVDKLEVVICEYGSAAEAKKAEQPGLDWVGSTTGAAWSAGSLVIAVADRKKSDPHGKTINQLMKSSSQK
jgi:hypothetical protein